MPAFRPHTTETSDRPWDGPAQKTRVRSGENRSYYGKIYAWYDPEGTEGAKTTYKFIHHEVGEDGSPGPANLTACSTGIGVLNGARGGTNIPAADRPEVWNHLARHLEDAGREAPPLAEVETEPPLWLRGLQDTAWALLPAKLEEILTFVDRRLSDDPLAPMSALPNGRRSAPDVRVLDGVAVIPVYGTLFKRANLLTDISGGTSVEVLSKQVQAAMDNPAVTAVLLDIESPGGTVDGIKDLADRLYASRGNKPIVAFGNDLMASGAYWLASAADLVLTTETALVGSIGVAMMHYDYSGRDAQQGVKRTAIYAGKYKRIASDEKPLSPEGAAYLQGLVDHLYGIFLEAVARHRGVTPEEVQTRMADGRLFVGRQALEAGLVDGLGNFEAALERARELGRRQVMDLQTFMTNHAALYQQIRESVTVAEAAALDPAGAEGLRAEGREAERSRVLEILAAPGPMTVKHQAIAEGWDLPQTLRALLEAKETARNEGLAELIRSAPPSLGQDILQMEGSPADQPLEKRALQEWDKKPEIRKEFGQFETYLAFRRAEAAGRAKILAKRD